MIKTPSTLLAALSLSLLSPALAATGSLRVVIGGQASGLNTATVGGRTYIPLEVLQQLKVSYTVQGGVLSIGGAPVGATAGGANERPSLEGCINEDLFDGVWRLKVISLDPIVKDGNTPGWGLTVELRNGSRATLNATDAGIGGNGQGIQLAFADANTLDVDAYEVQRLTFANLPQGGAVTQQLKFYYPFGTGAAGVKTPTKFLLQVDPKGIGDSNRAKGVAFSSPTPSFRVRLDCKK